MEEEEIVMTKTVVINGDSCHLVPEDYEIEYEDREGKSRLHIRGITIWDVIEGVDVVTLEAIDAVPADWNYKSHKIKKRLWEKK